MNAAVKKFITIEKSKALEHNNSIVLDQNIKKQELPKLKKIELKTDVVVENLIPIKKLKLGDRVKITDYSKSGILKEIKGQKVVVQIGNFTIKALRKDLFHP